MKTDCTSHGHGKPMIAYVRDMLKQASIRNVREFARMIGVCAPLVHEAAGCQSGGDCNGQGCRVRL